MNFVLDLRQFELLERLRQIDRQIGQLTQKAMEATDQAEISILHEKILILQEERRELRAEVA